MFSELRCFIYKVELMKDLCLVYFNEEWKPLRHAPHCKEYPNYVFLYWELRDLSPNVHIQIYVSDLYIPRIGPHISLQQNRQTYPGNIKISHRYMSVGTGR